MAEANDGTGDGGIVIVVQCVPDKRLVDLQTVDRELAKVRERGIACTKVINGQLDAEFV